MSKSKDLFHFLKEYQITPQIKLHKMNNVQKNIIDAVLENTFTQQDNIGLSELLTYLRKQHSTFSWNVNGIIEYMTEKRFIIFSQRILNPRSHGFMPSLVDKKAIEDACKSIPLPTKTALKTALRRKNCDVSNFKEVFDSMNFKFTGDYTSDNHKIYKLISEKEHLSLTKKGQVVEINDMPKPYLKNAALKNILSIQKLHDVLDDPFCEEFKLLKAYFTYDARQVLN